MNAKTALAVVCLVLVFCTAAMAQDSLKADSTNPAVSLKKAENIVPALLADPLKVEPAPIIRRQRLETGEGIPRSYTRTNALLMAALWTTTALDMHSSSHLDPARYHEANKFGSRGGQIATSALATGTAFLIDRYGPRRMRWLSSLLLSGAAAGHAFGAIHNYSLK